QAWRRLRGRRPLPFRNFAYAPRGRGLRHRSRRRSFARRARRAVLVAQTLLFVRLAPDPQTLRPPHRGDFRGPCPVFRVPRKNRCAFLMCWTPPRGTSALRLRAASRHELRWILPHPAAPDRFRGSARRLAERLLSVIGSRWRSPQILSLT